MLLGYAMKKPFSPSLWLVFHSLNGVSCREHLFHFDEVQFLSFFFYGLMFFMLCIRTLPKLKSQRSFSQKCYGFILYIYFEVIFV